MNLRKWLNQFHNTQYFINGYGDILTKKQIMECTKRITSGDCRGYSGLGLGRHLDKQVKIDENGLGCYVIDRYPCMFSSLTTIESHNKNVLENYPDEANWWLVKDPKKQKVVGTIITSFPIGVPCNERI